MKMYLENGTLSYMLEGNEYFDGCVDEKVFVEILVKENNLFSDAYRKETIIKAEKEFVEEMVQIEFIKSKDDTLCNTDDIYQFINGVRRMIFLMAHLWGEGKVVGGGFVSMQGIYDRDIKWMSKFCQQHMQDKKWFDEFQFEPRTPNIVRLLE